MRPHVPVPCLPGDAADVEPCLRRRCKSWLPGVLALAELIRERCDLRLDASEVGLLQEVAEDIEDLPETPEERDVIGQVDERRRTFARPSAEDIGDHRVAKERHYGGLVQAVGITVPHVSRST